MNEYVLKIGNCRFIARTSEQATLVLNAIDEMRPVDIMFDRNYRDYVFYNIPMGANIISIEPLDKDIMPSVTEARQRIEYMDSEHKDEQQPKEMQP